MLKLDVDYVVLVCSVHSVIPVSVKGMATPYHINPSLSVQEAEYFNWRCVICSIQALSSMHLEDQHMLYEYSVYTDVDNVKWVKCDECMTTYHLKCATNKPESKMSCEHFICTFMAYKK